MNWLEIFKRTAFVIITILLINLFLWWATPDDPYERSRHISEFIKNKHISEVIVAAILSLNLMDMQEHIFIGYYFKHVRWVIFLCFLGGLSLTHFVFGVSPSDFTNFYLPVAFLAFVVSVIFRIIHIREIKKGEISDYLTPEQTVEHLGEPNEIINSESGTTYLYNNLQIVAPVKGGAIGGGKIVERVPPPLPGSILGLSPAQIVNSLGFPKQIINLDSKIIYFYKDQKIVFIDEQVADVR